MTQTQNQLYHIIPHHHHTNPTLFLLSMADIQNHLPQYYPLFPSNHSFQSVSSYQAHITLCFTRYPFKCELSSPSIPIHSPFLPSFQKLKIVKTNTHCQTILSLFLFHMKSSSFNNPIQISHPFSPSLTVFIDIPM